MDWIWKDKSHCWKKTVLYSGRDYYLHHEGVAIILRKGVGRCLMKWKPISNRMVSAKLKGKHINITLIRCYAPKDDSSKRTNTNPTASYKRSRKRPHGGTSLSSWGNLMPRSEETTPTMKELWKNMELRTET